MAVSDPPFSTPRIMKVLDPGTGHYEVIVRMDPTAASKFPDEPFGTGIDQIGLAQKDSSKYVGYTLVSIEPADKGAKDHYWIFQKLDGPEFTTISKSKENLIPAKYRGQLTVVKTENEVAAESLPADLENNLVASVVAQTPNTGKAVLTEITETINLDAAPLTGLRSSQWGILSTSEQLVEEGDPLVYGYGIAESSVTPFGNGKSEQVVTSYPPATGGVIASLSDQDQDPENKIITDIEKILVTNDLADAIALAKRADGWYVERKGQDQFHSVMIASKVDTTSLPVAETFWDSDTVSLPDQLISLGILWGDEIGGGNGISAEDEGSSARANASASTSAAIAIGVRSGFSGRTKSKVIRTYHYGPPSANIAAPYNIQPVTGSVTLFSSSRSFTCSISKSSGGTSISRSESIGTSGRVIQIGPFLSAGVTATGTGVHNVNSLLYTASAGAVSANAQVTAKGSAEVVLPTSTPTSIGAGALISRYEVIKKWRLGIWIKETVEVYAP